jgi:hypothetical protein
MNSISTNEPKSLTETTVPLPDLTDPQAFDAWRRSCESNLGMSRANIAELLLQVGTHLGDLRAAQLLISPDPMRSRTLAARALLNENKCVHLMAKAHLATLDVLKAYSGTTSPEVAVQIPILILTKLFDELEGVPRSGFSLEVKVRIHTTLADALMLKRDFNKAQYHAAETYTLGTALGIESLASLSLYQQSCVEYQAGNLESSLQLLTQTIEHEGTGSILSNRSELLRALSLLALGDDNAVEQMLNYTKYTREEILRADALCIKFLTLRYDWFQDNDFFKQAPNGLAQQVLCWKYILLAQKTNPENFEERNEYFNKAQSYLHDVKQTALGWGRIHQRTLSAFISLSAHEAGIALQKSPSFSEIKILPLSHKIFSLSVKLESLHLFPVSAVRDILETMNLLAESIQSVTPHVLTQIVQRMQLLTPSALVLISRFFTTSDALKNFADECLLNLKTSTVHVYGKKGLRPMHAENLILESFGRNPKDSRRLRGGGQIEGYKNVLYREYHNRKTWFKAICSARIAFTLLCCAEFSGDEATKRHLYRSVKDMQNRFGFIIHNERSVFFSELQKIEKTLGALILGKMKIKDAAFFLFEEEIL